MNLVVEVYRLSRVFPPEEKYGLTSQIRRAAVSIPSNIAEGHGRKSTKVFLSHLSIAHGSLMELETQIEIAHRLDYIDADVASGLSGGTGEVGRLLNGLIGALRSKINAPGANISADSESRPLNPES